MATPVQPKKAAAAGKPASAPKPPKVRSASPGAADAVAAQKPSANADGLVMFGPDRVLPTLTRSTTEAYPFASLEVQHGFEKLVTGFDATKFKDEKEAAAALKDEKRKIHNRLTGAVRRYAKKDATRKFTVRTTEGGVAVRRSE